MRLQEVPWAGGAVARTPRATAGRARGAQMAPSHPAAGGTGGMGANVPRGGESPGTSVGRGPRLGGHWRRRQGRPSRLLTGRTVGLVRQADKRLRLLAAWASRRGGRGGPRGLSPAGAWPGQSQHDTQPQESQDQERIVKERWNQGRAPGPGEVTGAWDSIPGLGELSAAKRYTTTGTCLRDKDELRAFGLRLWLLVSSPPVAPEVRLSIGSHYV
jgi:hypothetical protein